LALDRPRDIGRDRPVRHDSKFRLLKLRNSDELRIHCMSARGLASDSGEAARGSNRQTSRIIMSSWVTNGQRSDAPSFRLGLFNESAW
jgi:hypothetical protein